MPVGKAQDEVKVTETYWEGWEKLSSLLFKVTSATSVDWYNFIRDICIQYFIDHLAVIGGPGKEVEIDESKFGNTTEDELRRGTGSLEGWREEAEIAFSLKRLKRMLRHCSPSSLSMSSRGQSFTATSGLHTISLPQRQEMYTSR